MITTVVLSSEAFGEETFEYKTLREALSGVRRLVGSSNKECKRDHISREIKVCIPPSKEDWDVG